MKKTTIISLIILLSITLLLVAGCGKLDNTTKGNNPENFFRENICTDNGELQISYLENMPPHNIFEFDRFYVGVKLNNDGCFPISEGYVSLGGYEEDVTTLLSGDRFELLETVEGKNIYSPDGGEVEMIFEAQNQHVRYNLPEASETISVNACYKYHTEANAQVCINPNRPDSLGIRNDVCEPGVVVLDSKQGAPVIIKKVRSSTLSVQDQTEITFDIFVENIGKVMVRDYRDGSCLGNSTVILSDVSFSDYSTGSEGTNHIECNPSQINLRKKKSTVSKPHFRCKAIFHEGFSAYTTILTMRLDYAYTITADNSFLIKKIE